MITKDLYKKKCPLSDPEIEKLLAALAQLYPDAHCELDFENPFQLLIATILSAQTTDKKVNQVTKEIFAHYDSPEALMSIPLEVLENLIRKIGLYRTKARNIQATCKILVEKFNGKVPDTMSELRLLPGVGQKTANVVLANAFGIPTIAVDTHVFRVSNRLGLAFADKVSEVEEQLKALIPQQEWINIHHQLIWHGRRTCKARKPDCRQCQINHLCCYVKQRF